MDKAASTVGTFLRGFRWGHVRQLDRVSRELPAVAADFPRETVGRDRYVGAKGPLTIRADSGFYSHDLVAVCREKDVRFSITARLQPPLRALIEAVPDADWTLIPWTDGPADMAETAYTPFRDKPAAQPVRLIVRRVDTVQHD